MTCSRSCRPFATQSGLKSTCCDSCWQLNNSNKAENEDMVAGQGHHLSDHITRYSVWEMGLALLSTERGLSKVSKLTRNRADQTFPEAVSAVKSQPPIASFQICDFRPTQPEFIHGNLRNGKAFLEIRSRLLTTKQNKTKQKKHTYGMSTLSGSANRPEPSFTVGSQALLWGTE